MKPAPYFSQIAPISLYDPLADLLGATENGVITYEFLDAVKLAGHACPTVAGAWLATVRGLLGHGTAVVPFPEHVDKDGREAAGPI